MKIVFSRKGFDSSAGGGPSPIVDGVPLTLPIPDGTGPSATTYGDLGLGVHADAASRGRYGAEDPCHHDPMFLADGTVLLGQCGAAQTHLANQVVGVGDLFLFFGLFREAGQAPHHRIFGHLRVERVIEVGSASATDLAPLLALRHPHALGRHGRNDAIYGGRGGMAATADPALRLTVDGGPPSLWRVPGWLRETGLSYHARPARWLPGGRLQSVARGQEFVADIGEREDARMWAEVIIAAMARR